MAARAPTQWDEAEAPPLFNYQHAIPQAYRNQLALENIGNGKKLAARAAKAYIAMQAAAARDGVHFLPISAYRTHEHQTRDYNDSIEAYVREGHSHDEAVALTQRCYAIPGTSEHEAGLAVDVGDMLAPETDIRYSFEDTVSFAWLQKNCTKYGFILRFRAETFAITHIHYEPWHYRYVGANHAERIVERGITLEEYSKA